MGKGEIYKVSFNFMFFGVNNLVVYNVFIFMFNIVGNIIVIIRESGNLEDYFNCLIKSEFGIVIELMCFMWGVFIVYYVISIDFIELVNM